MKSERVMSTAVKQSYVKDILLSFAIQIFENGRSLFLIPVIAKSIGASGYGIWTQVKIGVIFLCPFILLGLSNGISRFLPGSSKEEIRDGIYSSFAVTLSIAMVLAASIILLEGVISGLPIFSSLDKRSVGLFIKGLALLCIAEPLNNISLEYFRSLRKMRAILGFSILDTFFEFAPVFWFAYKGAGISVIIFSFACARLFMAVVKTLAIFSRIGIGAFRPHMLKAYIKFGFPLVWVTVFFYIANYLDRYLIGYFHSAKDVGIYSLAYTIGYIVVLISSPWALVLVPTITAKWNEGKYSEVKEYFESTIRYILLTVIPSVAFISISSEKIIVLLSTREFLGSKFIIPVMLASFLFFQAGVYYSYIVKLAYKSAPLLIMKVFSLLAVISFFLNMALIPRFSIFGAAATMIFVYFLMFIIFFRIVQKRIVIKIELQVLAKSIIATIPGCFILLFFNNRGTIAITVDILAAVSLYVITLWTTGAIGKKEYMFIIAMFNSRK